MKLRAWIVSIALIVSGVAAASPQAGWWWNAAETGRGFFIESQDGIMYLAGYLYDEDGRARWLVSGGPNADPYNYAGRLSEYASGQTLFGAYLPPAAPVDAGAITVHFQDDTHGMLTWPGGTIAITREIFDGNAAVFQPESGWWWNDQESGSGYSIEVQGGNIFFVGFMYDDAGKPVWYFAAGPMSSPTTFDGDVLQFSSGQTLTGPYHPPAPPAHVAHLAIEFDGADTGTLTFTDATPAAPDGDASKAGRFRFVPMKREFKHTPPPYVPPPRFDGNFTQSDSETVPSMLGGHVTVKKTITGQFAWVKDDASTCTPSKTGRQCASYGVLAGGKLHVHVDFNHDEPGTITCNAVDDRDVDMAGAGSHFDVWTSAQYELKLAVVDGTIIYDIPQTCTVGTMTVPGGNYTVHVVIELPVGKNANGAIVYGVQGSQPLATVAGALMRSGSWSFAAVKSP